MKKKIVCFIIALCIVLSFVTINMLWTRAAYDSSLPSDEAFDLVSDMGIGWNLGNTLDSISGQKTHDVTATETSWGNPVTTKQMIQMVADAGFKTVRVPVTYYDNSDTEANIDEEWLDRVEEVVNYVLDCDMYCIINVHHDTGMGAWINVDTENYEESSYRLQRLWQQIAERFKSYDNRLIFEGFNEILNSQNQWSDAKSENYENTNKLNQLFVDTVRASGGNNASRYLITNLYAAIPSAVNIDGFELPEDTIKDHIIVGFHTYSTDNAEIENIFSLIKSNFIDKGVSVILGEYGMTNSTDTDNTQARISYISNIVSHAKDLNIPCLWWDNGGKYDSAESVDNYALLDRYNLKWYFPELVNAMVYAFENDLTTTTTAAETTSKVTADATVPTLNAGDADSYTKVNALILSSGRKSIATDITLGLDSEYEITLSVQDLNKYGNFMLVSNDERICYRVRQELSYLFVAYGYNNFETVKLVANQKYVVSQKGNETYVDGELLRTCVTQNFEEGTLTIGDADMSFYGMKVTENGEIVHDLIPVLDASGKPCIRDEVTGKLYYAETDIDYVK